MSERVTDGPFPIEIERLAEALYIQYAMEQGDAVQDFDGPNVSDVARNYWYGTALAVSLNYGYLAKAKP